ncbi:MAG: DNA repair protein RadA [Patescibacteria group bacterium]
MSKINTIFTCSNCGAQYPKWQGRCLECGKWGTMEEGLAEKNEQRNSNIPPDKVINLNELKNIPDFRLETKISELDGVLGGGIVKGALILLGGDPGVGKSTLALQIAQNINGTLYISGEESANQIKIRAERLKINLDKLKFLAQTNIEKILSTIEAQKPPLVIVDSIQTMISSEATGSSGSVSQITSVASQLIGLAKKIEIPIIIIGHVTKDGIVAGPKTLEHLVDVVLYLENDNQNYYKILRGAKNRFGSTGEIGIFEMTSTGLKETLNSSNIFLEDSNQSTSSGTAISAVLEGSRPFLIEIQALTSKTSFGYPQRKSTGYDLNRLQMIIAVLCKIAKINLTNQDIYLNVTGGLKVKDTSIDLAVAMCIVSAFLDIPINKKTILFGELGLSGEIRTVPQPEKRIKEAEKLKFEKIIMPYYPTMKYGTGKIAVRDIREAIKTINSK